MLKVPELDNLTYDQMVQRAISRIPTMTDQWTDFNAHDPGITVVQTYAWLIDMLNYYMNATGDEHLDKYLKLLNIHKMVASPSKGFVVAPKLTQKLHIPEKSLFWAGEIPFETSEAMDYEYNPFCSCVVAQGDAYLDLTLFAGSDGDYADIFSVEGVGSEVYLGFGKPLQKEDLLYVTVKEDTARNPFGKDFLLATLSWEIYTSKGWEPLKVEDGTAGLLRSGFVALDFENEHAKFAPKEGEEAYYIRLRLEENHYDVSPMLGKIYVNPILLEQQETICRLDEKLPELVVGYTDGCAGQALEFDYPDAWKFSLLIGEDLWEMTDALQSADYKDFVFSYDYKERVISFGDGLHGAIPDAGLAIQVVGLSCSLLGGGNVLPGQITAGEDLAEELGELLSPEGAAGGCDEESIKDCLARLESTLMKQRRLASPADYEKLIKEAPGLRIDKVTIIPGREYGQVYHQSRALNEVMAVVKPVSGSLTPVLKDSYIKCLEEYIEPLRLINTKVTIVSPRYVGVDVRGRVRLSPDTPENRKELEEYISSRIDYTKQKKPFGLEISYGRLFTGIEALPMVSQLMEFSLERGDSAARKNERGDLIMNPDALSYVEKMEIEYV